MFSVDGLGGRDGRDDGQRGVHALLPDQREGGEAGDLKDRIAHAADLLDIGLLHMPGLGAELRAGVRLGAIKSVVVHDIEAAAAAGLLGDGPVDLQAVAGAHRDFGVAVFGVH